MRCFSRGVALLSLSLSLSLWQRAAGVINFASDKHPQTQRACELSEWRVTFPFRWRVRARYFIAIFYGPSIPPARILSSAYISLARVRAAFYLFLFESSTAFALARATRFSINCTVRNNDAISCRGRFVYYRNFMISSGCSAVVCFFLLHRTLILFAHS